MAAMKTVGLLILGVLVAISVYAAYQVYTFPLAEGLGEAFEGLDDRLIRPLEATLAPLLRGVPVSQPTVGPAPAGGPAKATLSDEPVTLLDGRILVRMPKGSTHWAKTNAPDWMPAAVATVRAIDGATFKIGDGSIHIEARETFGIAGADLEQRVRKIAARWEVDATVRAMTADGDDPAGGMVGYEIAIARPKPPKLSGHNALIRATFVKLPDGMVIRVRLTADPAALKLWPAWGPLADRIFESVRPGGAKLKLQSGPRCLPLSARGYQLKLDVPERCALVRDDRLCCMIYYLESIRPFGETGGGICIYYGHNAAYHHRQRWGRDPVPIVQSYGRLMGRRVRWHEWSEDEDGETVTTVEAHVFDTIPTERGAVIHASVTTGDPGQLARLKQCLRTLRVARPSGEDANLLDYPGEIIVMVAVIAGVLGWMLLLQPAFRAHVAWGVVVLLIPLGSLAFIIRRKGTKLAAGLLGLAVLLVGLAVLVEYIRDEHGVSWPLTTIYRMLM